MAWRSDMRLHICRERGFADTLEKKIVVEGFFLAARASFGPIYEYAT